MRWPTQLIDPAPRPRSARRQDNQAFVTEQQAQLRTQIEAAQTEVDEIDAKMGLETSARAIADLQSRRQARATQIESWRKQFADLGAVTEGSQINSLTIIESAAPGGQVGPNVKMNVLLAALIGLGLALGAALLLEYLDDTVKTTDHVERRLGIPGLATVHRLEDIHERRDGLVTVLQAPLARRRGLPGPAHQPALLGAAQAPRGPAGHQRPSRRGQEQHRRQPGRGHRPGGQDVVLLDADLRRPALHRFFGLSNSLGMTSLLLDDQLTIDDALQPVEAVPGLQVLTSGPLPPNPAEVLESPDLTQLLERLKDRADAVIVDSPPLLVVTDAAILAGRTDGTMLVVDSGTTRTDAARRAMAVLAKVGVTPVGAVVNKLDHPRRQRLLLLQGPLPLRLRLLLRLQQPRAATATARRPPAPSTPRRPAPGWMGKVREAMTSFLS